MESYRVVASYYMAQFESITAAMKEAEIPFRTDKFSHPNGTFQGFDLLVPRKYLEVARKLCLRVECRNNTL